jgi:hypothetical protein
MSESEHASPERMEEEDAGEEDTAERVAMDGGRLRALWAQLCLALHQLHAGCSSDEASEASVGELREGLRGSV